MSRNDRNSLNAGLVAVWNFEDPNPGTCVDTSTGGCALTEELPGVDIQMINVPSLGGDPKWEVLNGTSGGQFTTGAKGTNFRDSSLFFDTPGPTLGDNLTTKGAGGDISTITFATGQSFTLVLWVNPNSGGGQYVAKRDVDTAGIGTNFDEYSISGGAGGGGDQWQFTLSDGKPPSTFHGITVLTPPTTYVFNTYTMVTAIYDGPNDQAGIALNGDYPPSFTQGSSGNFGSINNDLYFGRGDVSLGRVNANYKFLGMWRRILTADEVSRLYANGNGIRYPFPDQSSFPDLPGARV